VYFSLVFSSLRKIASWLGLEFVQALFRAEAKLLPFNVFGITLTGFDRHTTDGIFGRTFILSVMTFMLVVTVAPMNHVCPASESHHQVEEGREQQER
jgi:hypothetical protein